MCESILKIWGVTRKRDQDSSNGLLIPILQIASLYRNTTKGISKRKIFKTYF
jgi:hypothetical protein